MKVTAKTERSIGRELHRFDEHYGWNQMSLRSYAFKRMAPVYESSGETAKNWIASGTVHDMAGRSLENLAVVQSFLDRTDRNAFEDFLVKHAKWRIPTKEDVHQRRGMISLDRGDYPMTRRMRVLIFGWVMVSIIGAMWEICTTGCGTK